ncbi:Hypothetical predicted protein [Paramuricea clavata]|uniref:Uncharacterized protein n=1 Tax=Paramuricea clavata TaxID=317549 RepID=A0A6S7I9U7_PARCT|nr:Hypothetical predicted protein [Paramuricea clavata]
MICDDDYLISSFFTATSYLVLCSRDNITVVIGRHALSSVDIDNMYLADGACKASYNATHAYVTTALNRCGTMYSETDQEMYYNNTLTAAIPTSPGSVITRKQSLAFTFKCTYSRLVSVSGFKFEPPKPVLTVEESDIGNFTVNMDSFKDAGFISSSSEDYPAFKSFEDRINIQYGVSTSNTDIVVRAETCRATPSSKPYDTPQYEFISEACDKDPTITHHSSGLQQYHQFSIQAFRFLVDHEFVYIHCDLRLCNKNIQDSVCTRSTTCSSRKRRDASPLETTERTFQLSIGPIMYREKTKEQNVKTDQGQEEVAESGPNTIMIVILICVGLIVVLLAVAVVFLVKRRGASQSTTSLEVIPMEYPADKMLAFGNGYVAEK